MAEGQEKSTEPINRKDRIELATKLFIEYHASLRAYDAIFAAVSVGMLAIIPVIAGFYIYVFKEIPYHLRFPAIIFVSLLANLFVLGFLKIFLALIKERSQNFIFMQLSFAEIVIFSEIKSVEAISEIYEKENLVEESIARSKKSIFSRVFSLGSSNSVSAIAKEIGPWGSIPYFIARTSNFVFWFSVLAGGLELLMLVLRRYWIN